MEQLHNVTPHHYKELAAPLMLSCCVHQRRRYARPAEGFGAAVARSPEGATLSAWVQSLLSTAPNCEAVSWRDPISIGFAPGTIGVFLFRADNQPRITQLISTFSDLDVIEAASGCYLLGREWLARAAQRFKDQLEMLAGKSLNTVGRILTCLRIVAPSARLRPCQ